MIADRVAALDWTAITEALGVRGVAATGALLTGDECAALQAMYGDDGLFRTRIVMQRHGYGEGEYKYLAYPLPPLVEALRPSLYRHLAPVANAWAPALGLRPFPADHPAFVDECRAAGQERPTPLLLRYGAGDYNCLHQDVYGAVTFPLQAVFLLSRPGEDFEGGELVLVEQRPRRQSRAEVVALRQGEGAVFAVRDRPAEGARGTYRVQMRHGVSRIRRGSRMTLGVIFHDAA